MSSRKKTSYYHIKFYERYLNDYKRNNSDFTVVKTTYSRKIQSEKRNLFFNDDGSSDILLLAMINSVRRDAKKFIDAGNPISEESFNYFGLLDIPVTGEVICKVDIRSAYWSYSLNKGIITENTNNKLIKGFDELCDSSEREGEIVNPSLLKKIKLKSLGALATEKHTQVYEKGKIISDELTSEKTKPLYIDINRGIDKLIHEASGVVRGCFYYYWDCIFMKKQFADEAVEFFKSKNYEVRIEETKLEFIPLGGGMLISQKDDKIYMCRREDRHLIEHLI